MKYFLFILLFILPSSAFAEGIASLSFFPAVGTYPIGDVFHVLVNVDTNGKTINAVEGKISFNKNELEIVGLSKDGSVLESWAVDPDYSNEDGTISFSGAMKSFAGSAGKIISIDFRALENTEAKVRFSTGAAILAADGQGTNILSVMNAGAYSLVPKEVIPVIVNAGLPVPQVLGASTSTGQEILVTSSTHPNEDKWYNEKTAKFSWTLPPDAAAVRLLADSSSSTLPVKSYRPPVTEKTISGVSDGISYFHLQVKTEFGWNESITYRFQTDTKKPEMFRVVEASTTDSFGFLFEARDKTSGIEKYLVSIDGGAETEWVDDGAHKYIPGEQKSGVHILSAKAVDFAGNFATSSVNFTLESVNPPTITDFQEKLLPGNSLVVRGKANANASVSVWVSKDGVRAEENKITGGSDGSFTFVLNGKAEEGTYKIYAEEAGRGVRSAPATSIFITVSKPKIILFGNTVLGYLSVLIPLVTLVLLLLFILVFGWHRFRIFRATLQKEVQEVETASRESFSVLRKEIYEDERILASIESPKEKTKKESEVIGRLKKSIDTTEANVEKEISDIKAQVKKPVKIKINKVG
jgi:hypothetical protein